MAWMDGSPLFGTFLGAKGCNERPWGRQCSIFVSKPFRLLLPPLPGLCFASHFVCAISCIGCAAKRDFSLASLALQQLISFGKNQYC